MGARELKMSRSALDTVHRHAAEGYPHEVVGILAGRGRVERAAALINERADSPQNRYHVSGLALMRAEQALVDEGLEIIGYYHSHPDHEAQYSDFDREHALPNLSYVIVAVRSGRPEDTRSWRLRDDRAAMDEETLVIEESP